MSTTTLNATITDVNQNFFRDPINPARRGRTEAEANRRWRQVLEMQLSASQDCSLESARQQVKAQRPWLYEATDAAIAAQPPVPLTREQNFIEAYTKLGYSPLEASRRGMERVGEDDAALFTVPACTDYRTAQETVWLLEAAMSLCAGEFGNKQALELVERVRESLLTKPK